MARYAALTLLFVALLAACGGSDTADAPADLARRVIGYLDNKQGSRAYDDLHPAQQAIIPRDLFVSCYARGLEGVRFTDVKVIEVADDERPIPGTDQRGATKAVTVEYTIRRGEDRRQDRQTISVFPVDGRYRWIVRDPQPYREGRCP